MMELCKRLGHYETDPWAARAILQKEALTRFVVDPCVGTGILAETAKEAGSRVLSYDIHNWGYKDTIVADWLDDYFLERYENREGFAGYTCFMNPPFEKAEEFVEKAFERNFDKIICFQRFAWYESRDRKNFWDKYPPNRVYVCGDRATCWRHDIPINERGKRYDPETGRELAGSSTAHAWFIWEKWLPAGTLLGRIYKGENE